MSRRYSASAEMRIGFNCVASSHSGPASTSKTAPASSSLIMFDTPLTTRETGD